MELKTMKLKDIIPYEKNARINDGAIDVVAKSIEDSGYVAPIIIDENNVILAGHTRISALKKLGFKEIEVVVKTGLTEAQKKAYRIADNRTNEFAKWDYELLDSELEELANIGVDMSYLNFEIPDDITNYDFDNFFTDKPTEQKPSNDGSTTQSQSTGNTEHEHAEHGHHHKFYRMVLNFDTEEEMEELAHELRERGYKVMLHMGESE